MHPLRVDMKKKEEPNRLCISCRRYCKQPAAAVIASCPRYYPFPKMDRKVWKQLELKLS